MSGGREGSTLCFTGVGVSAVTLEKPMMLTGVFLDVRWLDFCDSTTAGTKHKAIRTQPASA